MAQPSGRICGFPSRYRTYLRCSPLICGADMLSIVIRLNVIVFYLRLSFLEGVGILLHSRFDDNSHGNGSNNQSLALGSIHNDDDGGGEGIQALERITWLRWLWFLLGTLPPAIKLASMTGVGWAQIWGMMFLGSWVINEAFILIATLNQSFFTISSSGHISWPGYEQNTRSANFKHIQQCLDRCEKILGIAALSMHVVVLNNVFRIILRLVGDANPLSAVVMSEMYVSAGYIWILSMVVWVTVGLVRLVSRERISFFGAFILGFLFSGLGNSGVNSTQFGGQILHHSAISIWPISAVVTLITFVIISFFGRRFIMVGRNLLILHGDATDGQFVVDYRACLLFIFFLSTIFTSLFWYSKIYNSSGTTVPGWTGVFG